MADPDLPTAAQIYADARDQLVARLLSCSPEQIATLLPACPEWTVRDVAAHLSGLVAEVIAGVEPPRGSDQATSRQVNDRAEMSIEQILAEWQANADAIFAAMSHDENTALGLSADLAVHIHDICEGLGMVAEENDPATLLGARRYRGLLQERVADRLNIALTVDLTDTRALAPPNPDAEVQITLRATPHNFLRAVTGRRSRADVLSMDWSSDATTLVDQAWRQYGQFNDA